VNLPNLLTSLRLILIPIYIAFFIQGHMIPAFLIVAAAGATDVLDGYIARRRGQVTTTGMLLDPLADKLLLAAIIISLLLGGYISWAAAGLMVLRDGAMIIGSMYVHFRGKRTVPANWMGKLTTVLFYTAFMFIFFSASFAAVFLWAVIAFSYVSAIVYVAAYKKLNKTLAGDGMESRADA